MCRLQLGMTYGSLSWAGLALLVELAFLSSIWLLDLILGPGSNHYRLELVYPSGPDNCAAILLPDNWPEGHVAVGCHGMVVAVGSLPHLSFHRTSCICIRLCLNILWSARDITDRQMIPVPVATGLWHQRTGRDYQKWADKLVIARVFSQVLFYLFLQMHWQSHIQWMHGSL